MNARIPSPTLPTGARTTTVFTSGNNQAVRLPKDFRFSGKTVEIIGSTGSNCKSLAHLRSN